MFSSNMSSIAPRPCRCIAARALDSRHSRTAAQLIPSFQSTLATPKASFTMAPLGCRVTVGCDPEAAGFSAEAQGSARRWGDGVIGGLAREHPDHLGRGLGLGLLQRGL